MSEDHLKRLEDPESSLILTPQHAAELINSKNMEILKLLCHHSSMSIQSMADSLDRDEEEIGNHVKELFEQGLLDVVKEGSYRGFKFDFDVVQISFQDLSVKSDE